MVEPSRRSIWSPAVVIGLALTACTPEAPPESAESTAAPLAALALRPIEPPSGPGAMAPNLALGRDSVFLTWLEPTTDDGADGAGHTLYISSFVGEAWSPAQEIVSGDRFFANWADLPGVTEAADGTRFAHWLSKLGDATYTYGAALARSRDGKTWDEIGLLHDDASPTEHGFVAYTSLPTGGIQAFWLDGRAMLDEQGMQLRTTVLGAEGPQPSTILDDRVCECCATDAALTADGAVVVYRDRSDTEIRDIAVLRATADGWSEPTLIHDDGWQIHGCPVNGPAIDAEGDRIAVAWFTAAENHATVQVAFSDDGGATFSQPIPIDEAEPLGRVDLVLTYDGSAVVSWLGTTDEAAEIRWRRVAPNGAIGAPQIVAATTAERSAGVPRMVLHGDQLLFAWVEAGEPSALRTGLVSLG